MKLLPFKFTKVLYKVFVIDKLAFVAMLSVVAWYLSYQQGLSTSYNDAMSHLNLSRLVIDNLEPGLSQIGGVWLPLNHILSLVFIWNDWAWHSGFAGSFFSMLSFVIASWGIYQIVYILTRNVLASVLGAAAFALNANMLYLQTTPLTEPLYLAFFVLSALFFIKYMLKDSAESLLLVGFFGLLQVITRYDGWFVVVMEGLLIAYYELIYKRHEITEALGKLLLFVFPVAFGIILWLLWNLLIFGNAFFFAFGPYSARAQQQVIEAASGLITKGNVAMSMLAYWYAVLANVGKFTTALAVSGLLSFLFFKHYNVALSKKVLLILFLLTPVFFNILALYLGFSILNLPELNWGPGQDPGARWFNVRYGILALPLAAVLIGLFVSWRKIMPALIAIEILVLQFYLMYPSNVITITDGIAGSSSFKNADIAQELKKEVGSKERVLLSLSNFNPVAFKSDIKLSQIVHEGVSKQWPFAMATPQKYVTWIVMANGSVGEPVYITLVEKQKNRFLEHYELAYQGKHANIYRLKRE